MSNVQPNTVTGNVATPNHQPHPFRSVTNWVEYILFFTLELQQTRLENCSNSSTDRVFKSLSELFDFDFSDLWIFPDLLERDDAGRLIFFRDFWFSHVQAFLDNLLQTRGKPNFSTVRVLKPLGWTFRFDISIRFLQSTILKLKSPEILQTRGYSLGVQRTLKQAEDSAQALQTPERFQIRKRQADCRSGVAQRNCGGGRGGKRLEKRRRRSKLM